MGGKTFADSTQQLPSMCRIAALLACHKTGFRRAFRDDVRDKVVKQPLHTRAGGSRRAQQRFVPGIVTTVRNSLQNSSSYSAKSVAPMTA